MLSQSFSDHDMCLGKMCGKCWDRDRRWSEANLCDQWSNQGTNQGTTLFNKHHLPYHFILSSPWHRSFAAEVLKSWYSLRSLVCWCCWWTKFPCHLVWMVWIVDVGCCVELCKVVLGDVEKCLIAIRSLSMLINSWMFVNDLWFACYSFARRKYLEVWVLIRWSLLDWILRFF